jgi:hypothetical protein
LAAAGVSAGGAAGAVCAAWVAPLDFGACCATTAPVDPNTMAASKIASLADIFTDPAPD